MTVTHLPFEPRGFDRGRVDIDSPRGEGVAAAQRTTASRTSQRGLDWFSFFVADVQTGFGPFVAVYLTAQSWSQLDIGLVLTAGGLVALAGQMPGGALVDAARSRRLVATLAMLAIGASALILAVWPVFLVVMASRALHAAASCVLGPAIAAISLRLVGHAGMGERLGRNARFASIGNGLGAAAMGACGFLFSDQAVFFFTAALVMPALLALAHIRISETAGETTARELHQAAAPASFRRLLGNRPLLIFAACAALFQLANAAMLPLMGSMMATQASEWATMLIAACIVVPQLVVAGFSPFVGRQAQRWGRRPLLVICFAALAARGVLFALINDPYVVMAVQVLDGVSAAVLAVIFPLIVVDVTRKTGRLSLALGIVGTAVGIGAALSTTLAGYMSDHLGSSVAFLGLAGVAALGLATVWLLMPETRPEDELSRGDAGKSAMLVAAE